MVHLNEALPKHDLSVERPIRVGYVSADFGEHPVGYFAKAVLLRHDRESFEVYFYSQRDAVSEDDAVSQAFRGWVGESHWRWIKDCNPFELVRQIRSDQIDILVDLRDILKAIDWMPFVIERLRCKSAGWAFLPVRE